MSEPTEQPPGTVTVSIITPAFDAERYIGETVQSVLGQSRPDWELIVVDDGSADATVSRVEAFADPRIRILRGEHSGLPAVARNRGIAAARGEFIAFLDSDDVWLPQKLERQLARFVSDPQAGVLYSGADRLVGTDRVAEVDGRRASTRSGSLLEDLIGVNHICNSSAVVRRSVLESSGPFSEDPRLKGTEDYELWLRLAADVRFVFVDEPLVLYRVHDGALSADTAGMAAAKLAALEVARAARPERFAALEGAYLRAVGGIRCFNGLPDAGRRELFAAVRLSPGDRLAWKWLTIAVLGPARLARLRRRPWTIGR